VADDLVIIGRVELSGTTSAAELERQLGSGGMGGAASEADAALGGLAGSSSKAGAEAEKAATKHRGLTSSMDGMARSGLGLNSMLGVLGGTFAGGFVAVEGGKWLAHGVMAAATMEQQVTLLNRTMEKNAGISPQAAKGVDEWAMAMSRHYGISHEQLLPDLSKMVAATHNIGESEKLMGTAADIAAGRHISLDSVIKALGKGAQGTVGGLARLGLQTKDSSGKALSFAQIMKEANKTYGGDAQTAADTTAGRMAKLQETFSQTKEKVMTDLIPAFNWVLGGLTSVAGYLPTVGRAFETAWREVIGPAVMWAWNNVLHPTFDAIVRYVQMQIAVDKVLATGAEWAWKTVIGPTVKIVWSDFLKPTWDLLVQYVKTMIRIDTDLANAAIWAWKTIIGPTIKVVWNDLIKPVWDLEYKWVTTMIATVKLLASGFVTAWNTIASIVTTVYNHTLKPIFSAVESGMGAIGKAASFIGGLFGGGGSSAAHGGPAGPAAAQSIMSSLAQSKGWNASQLAAWRAVIGHEDASYSLTATNRGSGAYGIAQGISGPSWYAAHGGNAGTMQGQLTAMMNYIVQRYGTPANAEAHELKFGWYDQGGYLPARSLTLAMNMLNTPEPVGVRTPAGPGGSGAYYLQIRPSAAEGAMLDAMVRRET
jgi:hypothetical protein